MAITPQDLTANLDVIGSADLALAGGKGASLGAMLGAGLPVPEGFAVLTQAYRDFVDHNGLAEPVRHLVEDVPGEDPAVLGHAAQALKDRFLCGAIPPHVREAIAAAYAEIGAGLVVVRSSATAEDLPGASFAGQHDSFLNVEGPQDVAEAVRGAWASL
jgi:phosphoenolpyruvate synthase/pyruvate phosphate dikinase